MNSNNNTSSHLFIKILFILLLAKEKVDIRFSEFIYLIMNLAVKYFKVRSVQDDNVSDLIENVH